MQTEPMFWYQFFKNKTGLHQSGLNSVFGPVSVRVRFEGMQRGGEDDSERRARGERYLIHQRH